MSEAVLPWGVSAAARYIDEQTSRFCQFLHKSAAVGFQQVIHDELPEVWEECREPNWDGYDALPVSWDAFRNMRRFLRAFPIGFQRPTIAADPHGHLSVEWYRNPRRVLSVGVSEDGMLHYAALLGASKTCGTETFFEEVPQCIVDLVGRVYA